MLKEYTLLVEADVDFFVTCQREAAALLKTVKRMLYLGYVLLRYVLICNLEVSFNFHVTFLQLNVIKMFTVHYKNCSNFFRFPLNVRVIGSRLYLF